MQKDSYIVVTGAAGFIGSCLVSFLNKQGYVNLILVDAFGDEKKELNLRNKLFSHKIEREDFFNWLTLEEAKPAFIFHIGARTDTAEFDYAVHQKWNVDYSISIWQYCAAHSVPLVYASSAATYGDGSLGYDDRHEWIDKLIPLNPYGMSKNNFDIWALAQTECPPFWAGLKFFNVYGPNEYHKARMASVIFHSYNQIMKDGIVKLFKSHKEGFEDGKQLRDFIYVIDICKVCFWLLQNTRPVESGIYNLGTGKARTFLDLVYATFAALNLEPSISFIDMPLDIREKYQYFTEANMKKLHDAGYNADLYSLEKGVEDYVRNYLSENSFY
ncbi:MAG: ADP-glyceromanno-heptose 6-epimerase [Ferruginibacter sp.]|nr:ADP-glyceromanno-heptose 6-epimerase [Ferruginibacter sp.]